MPWHAVAYNKLIQFIAIISSILMHKLFYLTSDVRLFYWTKLFDIIDGNISRDELDLNESHDLIVTKLIVRTKFIFNLLNYLNITFCK